ncbi:MAG: hypothetical protein AAFO94_15085, partial [Bacteroidota bacterium]
RKASAPPRYPPPSNSGGYRGGADAFLLRLNAAGEQQQMLSFGGRQFDVINDIGLSPNGQLLLAGYTQSADGDITLNRGLTDGWLLRCTAAGQVLWSKTYGGASQDQFAQLAADGDQWILTGHSASGNEFRNGGDDAWLVKVAADGTEVWQQQFGGDGKDRGLSVLVADGQYLVAGYSSSFGGDVGAIAGGTDGWLFASDADGQLQWSKTLGGSGNERFTSVLKNFENKIIVAGQSDATDGAFTANNGRSDNFIAAYNLSGDYEWLSLLGGSKNELEPTLAEGPAGGLCLLGASFSADGDLSDNNGAADAWLLKFEGSNQLMIDLPEGVSTCAGGNVELIPDVINCNDCSYQWDDGPATDRRTVMPDQSQWYQLTVTGSDGQSVTDSVFVEVLPLPDYSVQKIDIRCHGEQNGSIRLSPNETLTYEWSNGSLANEITNLPKGSYAVTISNAMGCSSMERFEIVEPSLLGVEDLNIKDLSCFESMDGQIAIQLVGGTAPLNVSIDSNDEFVSTGTRTFVADSLSSRTYQLIYRDANGCSLGDTVFVDQPANFSFD